MLKTEEKSKENETQGQTVDVQCVECKRRTKHRVVMSLDKKGDQYDKEDGWGVSWSDNYQVIQCQGCETTTFRHTHWFSEDHNPEFGEDGTTERLYPKRDASSLTAKPLLNVPTALRKLYGEIVDCFNNGSPTLCAGGLRAIVEGLCASQGIADGLIMVPTKEGATKEVRSGKLVGRIAGLHEKGLLTAEGARTLQEHRSLGNEALHELARPSQDELKLAIEMVEHVLEQIYEIPEKVRDLRRSIATRKE